MKIAGALMPNGTPVLTVPGPKSGELSRVWGGAHADGAWRFPAFAPFATWAARDLRAVAPKLDWTDAAVDLVRLSAEHARDWARAERRFAAGLDPEDAREGFFRADFTPYRHQRLGVERMLHWDRTLLRWEAGTGKTRTAVDGLRLRAQDGRFRKALIVGPPVVLGAWERDGDRASSGGLHVARWGDTKKARRACAKAQLVLATYGQVRESRERKLFAERELAIDPDMRRRYGKQPLTPEREAELRDDLSDPLAELDFDTIVADESHYIAGWASDQTQAMLALSAKAAYRYLLTGTFGDDPRKAYPQLYFLSPAFVPMPFDKFVDRHTTTAKGNAKIVTGFAHMGEVNERVNAVAHSVKKRECIDIPAVVTQDVFFDMGPAQRARYNELVLDMRASEAPKLSYAHPSDREDAADPVEAEIRSKTLAHGAARSLKLMQVISGYISLGSDYSVCDGCPLMRVCVDQNIRPYTKKCQPYPEPLAVQTARDIENPKLDALRDLLEVSLGGDPSNKVIIWCLFTPELDDVEGLLKSQGYTYLRIDGSNSSKVDAMQAQFQSPGGPRVWLGQIRTGIGIDLTAANYMIYYSVPWDPNQYNQAAARFDRPGQRRSMTIYRLLTSDRTWAQDRHVVRLLQFKDAVSATIAEKVACVTCDRQVECDKEGVLPFRAGCVYSATVQKPKNKVEAIE